MTISLPREPADAETAPFPVIASLAPVMGSVLIWAVTGSAFALVFAILGPVIAVASLGDARWQSRKRLRRERARFEAEVAAAGAAIAEAHSIERAALQRRAPSACHIVDATAHDPEWWRSSLDNGVPVTLGVGTAPSALVLEPTAGETTVGDSTPSRGAIAKLRADAAVLEHAPVIVDARLGIGICGPAAPAAAMARSLVVQLATRLPPDTCRLAATVPGPFDWVTLLPHPRTTYPRTTSESGDTIEFSQNGSSSRVLVSIAARESELPRDCRVVVKLGGRAGARLVRHPDVQRSPDLVPEFITAEAGMAFSRLLSDSARAAGLSHEGVALPDLVRFVSDVPPADGRRSLRAHIGRDEHGPVTVDLVADGPHAVIGGTTGSGKSELLISWVLSLAAGDSPRSVNFLLVDFKGGASFTALRRLPHCVGMLTDLDSVGATRALASLRAELRHRERVLADSGCRAIGELEESVVLPRLIVVVDEFAAMVSDFPDLHEVFADIAARGRSLGVHLILCTQRPAGVVRDAVLANCALRMSLRVTNAADSMAVIDSPAAAGLPVRPAGRALVSVAGSIKRVQLVLADDQDIAAVTRRWAGWNGPVRRPWCEPLPRHLPFDSLPPPSGPGLAFGLMDVPEEQRQDAALYEPERAGNMLIVGGHRSGRTGALAAIHAASGGRAGWVPSTVEGCWDVLGEALATVRGGQGGRRLLLLDDVDLLMQRCPPDHEHALADLICSLLREGGAAGFHLVVSARQVSGEVNAIAGLCGSRLVLGFPDRHEHLLAGGEPAHFQADLPAGGGHWGGHRVQVAVASVPAMMPIPEVPLLDLEGWSGLAVVSAAPEAIMPRLRTMGDVSRLGGTADASIADLRAGTSLRRAVVVGDPEAWQAHWGLIGSVRGSVPLAFHGCSVGDFRALTRVRTLPPPITSTGDTVWLMVPNGTVSRVRLPSS